MTDREELFDKLCTLIPDIDTRSRLYLILDKYEISKRETAVALLKTDRNEYLLQAFIVAKTVKGCTKRTLTYYATTVRFVFQYIGKTADDITTEDIRLYIAKRIYQDRVSKTTVGNEIRNLRSFFGYLYQEELLKQNPMFRIDTIKKEKTKKSAFDEYEIEKMRAVLKTNRDKAIFEILLSTGCRVSELVNIKLCEIDGDKILVHGKGQKDRNVYLNAKAMFALEQYLAERKDTNPYLLAGGYLNDDRTRTYRKNWYKNPECVTPDQHLNKASVEQMMRRISKKVDVHAYPHKFRRTCATYALRRGMPIEQVQKILGHSQIDTTMQYAMVNQSNVKTSHQKYMG